MQRDERAHEAFVLQFGQRTLGRIERMRVDARIAQALQHEAPGIQRYLALGRIAAEEHCHFAECFRIDLVHVHVLARFISRVISRFLLIAFISVLAIVLA